MNKDKQLEEIIDAINNELKKFKTINDIDLKTKHPKHRDKKYDHLFNEEGHYKKASAELILLRIKSSFLKKKRKASSFFNESSYFNEIFEKEKTNLLERIEKYFEGKREAEQKKYYDNFKEKATKKGNEYCNQKVKNVENILDYDSFPECFKIEENKKKKKVQKITLKNNNVFFVLYGKGSIGALRYDIIDFKTENPESDIIVKKPTFNRTTIGISERAITVFGIYYNSIRSACDSLGITSNSQYQRICEKTREEIDPLIINTLFENEIKKSNNKQTEHKRGKRKIQ